MDDIKNNSNSNIVRNRAALEHTNIVERGLLENGVDDEFNRGKHSNGVCVVSSKKPGDHCWNFCKNRPILMCALISLISIFAILIAFFLGKWSSNGLVSCFNVGDNAFRNETHIASSVVDQLRFHNEPTFIGTPIVRLSRHVSPVHYDLSFNLRNLHERRFTGSVSILLRCDNDTDIILLHAGKEITVDNVELFNSSDSGRKTEMKILKLLRENKSPWLTIQAKYNMKQDSFYVLKIDFSTIICGQRSGFVCGNNEYVDLPEKVFMATKFEPNFARTAFPCFDEPHLKATFNLSIVRTREMTVLTNTPSLKKVRQGKGDMFEQFEQTPPMSTYLFALVVAPLVSQEAKTDRGVKIAIWTRFDDKKKAQFALTYAVHVLNSIENYFMIHYPMSKLDLVALDYYPVGGMENWGLILFHNQMLLFDDEEPTTTTSNDAGHGGGNGKRMASKFKVAHIIAHELLHQWFGNLVTMNWWSNLWLNEGFAMFYLSYFVKHDFAQLIEFHSFWKLSQTWTRQTELPDADQRPALIREFQNEESINDAFDEWNLYAKGSTMVKLLWDLLGEASLRGGLINYLKSNAYGAVSLNHLWQSLGQQFSTERQVSIGRIMNGWLINPGFPELHVTRDYKLGNIHVRQRMADFNNNLVYWNRSNHKNYTWSIPVAYIIQENLDHNSFDGFPFWLHNESDTFKDNTLTANQWLLANPNFQFPYRVNYDLQNWRMLSKQLTKKHDIISPRSRMQLILDSSFFLRETDNVEIFIELLHYLTHETELLPAMMGMQELFSLFDSYKATSVYPYLIVYFRPVVAQLTKLRDESKENDEQDAIWSLDQTFDLTLKLLQCATNHEKCKSEKEEIQGFLSLPLSTNSGKLVPVCHYLYRKAEASDKAELLRWLEQTAGRRGDIVLLSGCIRDRKLNRRMVSLLIEKKKVKLLGSAIAGAYSLSYNSIVHQEIWTQLGAIGNDRLIEMFKDNQILQRMMLKHVGTLSEFTIAKKAFGFFVHDLNYVESALEWRQQSSPHLEQWLMEELNIL